MRRGGNVSGAVSLVMIFCVLCMSVFAVLTLATANRERTLAELTAQRAEEYYEADRQAVEISASLNESARPDQIDGVDITYAQSVNGPTAQFVLPVGKDQQLEVSLLLTPDGPEVLRWKTVYTADWEPETALTLWDGIVLP